MTWLINEKPHITRVDKEKNLLSKRKKIYEAAGKSRNIRKASE